MPLTNDRKPAADLGLLLKELSEHGIRFILVGGVAAVAQGAPVTTFDLDVVYLQTEENISKIKTFLSLTNAILRRPDDRIIKPDPELLKKRGHLPSRIFT